MYKDNVKQFVCNIEQRIVYKETKFIRQNNHIVVSSNYLLNKTMVQIFLKNYFE